MIREPLTKEQVIRAIERTGGDKIPNVFHKWWGNGLEDKYGAALTNMAQGYPDDVLEAFYLCPEGSWSPVKNPSYRWGYKDYTGSQTHSIGQHFELLDDWEEYDQFLADFPDPHEPEIFDKVKEKLEGADGRYLLGGWWNLFHEQFWNIRGMENLMMDYYDEMDNLKDLGRRLLEFYKVIIDRYANLGFNGILSSDDLGHQTGPMMSPAVFEELYLPLYTAFAAYVHQKGMHFWLHSCGDNTKLMDYLVQAGVDVFHPVQKGCMDEALIARAYGDKISFLVGMDVQHALPEGTVSEVEAEVDRLVQTFYKPQGGMLFAAGNGIMPDCPLENIEAFFKRIAQA